MQAKFFSKRIGKENTFSSIPSMYPSYVNVFSMCVCEFTYIYIYIYIYIYMYIYVYKFTYIYAYI